MASTSGNSLSHHTSSSRKAGNNKFFPSRLQRLSDSSLFHVASGRRSASVPPSHDHSLKNMSLLKPINGMRDLPVSSKLTQWLIKVILNQCSLRPEPFADPHRLTKPVSTAIRRKQSLRHSIQHASDSQRTTLTRTFTHKKYQEK